MSDLWLWMTLGLLAASLGLGIGFVRAARRTRIGPGGFCARCGYSKAGLADADCPECGCRIQTRRYIAWRRLVATGVPLAVVIGALAIVWSGGRLLARLPEPLLVAVADPEGSSIGRAAHDEVIRRVEEGSGSTGAIEYLLYQDLARAVKSDLVALVRNPVARDAPVFVTVDQFCIKPTLVGAMYRVAAGGREVASDWLGGEGGEYYDYRWRDGSKALSPEEASGPLTISLSYPHPVDPLRDVTVERSLSLRPQWVESREDALLPWQGEVDPSGFNVSIVLRHNVIQNLYSVGFYMDARRAFPDDRVAPAFHVTLTIDGVEFDSAAYYKHDGAWGSIVGLALPFTSTLSSPPDLASERWTVVISGSSEMAARTSFPHYWQGEVEIEITEAMVIVR